MTHILLVSPSSAPYPKTSSTSADGSDDETHAILFKWRNQYFSAHQFEGSVFHFSREPPLSLVECSPSCALLSFGCTTHNGLFIVWQDGRFWIYSIG